MVELNNNKILNLHSTLNIRRVIKSRIMKWAEHASLVEENKNAYTILIGNIDRGRPHRKHNCTLEDNIKIDVRNWGVMILTKFIGEIVSTF
jgi:hypothetical protein